MAVKQVIEGQSVRLKIRFKDFDGALIDPTTVTVYTLGPSSTVPDTWVYGTDVEVVKEGTGTYYMDIETDSETGVWYWRVAGTGSINNVKQGTFYVEPESP